MHYVMHFPTCSIYIYTLGRYGGANCFTFINEIPLYQTSEPLKYNLLNLAAAHVVFGNGIIHLTFLYF